MGMALGWMVLALAVVGQPDAGRGGVPIQYKVRFVEVEGLGWREAVFARMTPVARQGSATVWTAPASVAKRLLRDAAKGTAAKTLQAPTVTAWSGAPAHITTRASRQLLTQVSWDGDEGAVSSKSETVRTGTAATLSGRKLDQGILVRMVLQDTQVLNVHLVKLSGPKGAHVDRSAKQAAYFAAACEAGTGCLGAAELAAKADVPTGSVDPVTGEYRGIVLPRGQYMHDDVQYFPSGPDLPWTNAKAATRRARMRAMGIEPPPAFPGQAPTPAVGALGVDGASAIPVARASEDDCCAATTGSDARTTAVEVPEIGNQEIAGEWLIPKDGILLVSFGPHTIAGKDGKAYIRERLAIVEADEADSPILPTASRQPVWGVPGMIVPAVPAPAAMAPAAPLRLAIPAPIAPMPPMPARSTPQGYHKDGKPAVLPQLPVEPDVDENDSAETRPSPQAKKTRKAEPASPRPSTDAGMKKAHYTEPASVPSSFPVIPTQFQPMPTVGLQFLVPIKPISIRLPFNRRLEIEIYGRVVRGPETPILATTKDSATTK